MPSYSFNSTIQSIIQSIINFFKNLFSITRGQPIKTQLPQNVRPIKTIEKYHPLPSDIIKKTKISQPKLPILPLPIITRHKINIENPPKINKRLPILSSPIIRQKSITINNLPSIPIKIFPNKSLSQLLNNNSKTNNISTNTLSRDTSTSSINLSQIAINPNVPLSQSLTQGRTIIPAKPKNPNTKGNNENNSSQSNTSNSKSIIVNPIEYELYNTIRNSTSSNFTKSNNRKVINKKR